LSDRPALQAASTLALTGALLVPVAARATDGFDPSDPEATFSDDEAVLFDLGGAPTWNRVERHRDPDPALFRTEDFPPGGAWRDADPLSPGIAEAFGADAPGSDRFLLHFGPGWASADREHPTLLVPGYGTSASGVLVPMARHLAADGRAVFAISFAHPHGDCFQQAEQVANAVARIREVTGAQQVDVVAHGKGAISAAVYLAHTEGAAWSETDGSRGGRYSAEGTPYRGDVRRFVAVGAPLGGLDSAFRWTWAHPLTGAGDDPLLPSAWHTWYPSGSAFPLIFEDLRGVDLWPEGGDAFPGHPQLLRAWDDEHPLPGLDPTLGVYAAQPDPLTTYYGGLGLWSLSSGLASAVEAGDSLLDRLDAAGIDPAVQVAVVAGSNPLVPPSGPTPSGLALGGGAWGDEGPTFFAGLLADVVAPRFPGLSVTDAELQAVASGELAFGEVSGRSDGVVFTASAQSVDGLLSRGAELVDSYEADLNHVDLLFASVTLGEALIARGEASPEEDGWLVPVGERWVEADTLGWLAALLADGEVEPGDDDDAAGDDDDDDDSAPQDDDDSAPQDDDDSAAAAPPSMTSCGCASTPTAGGGLTLLAPGLLLVSRRRRR